jgi:two-component system, LuxR family, response regulator FixJ
MFTLTPMTGTQTIMRTPRHGPSTGGVVVIVDDDPAVCNALKFSLEIEGFDVRLYENGAQLLNDDAMADCSCLVVDERMPGIGGIDLIVELRQRNFASPTILMTSAPNTALARRAATINVPIVEKPLLTDALLDLIRSACATGNLD